MWQDADIAGAAGRVMSVGGRLPDPGGVAGEAGVVGLGRIRKPVAPAGSVAVDAVQLAGFRAGAEPPGGEGVIFSQVPSVGIEIRMLQRDQVEVIKVAVAGGEAEGQGRHFGVAGRAGVIALLRRQCAGDDELEVGGGRLVGGPPAKQLDVRRRGAVAGLAVNARLGPGGVVAVGSQVVVLLKLADVATEARRVEGQRALLPVERLVVAVAEMANCAGGGIQPFPAAHVISDRQHLQLAPLQRREEIEHILASHHLHHRETRFALRAALNHHPALEIGPEPVGTRHHLLRLRGQLASGQFRRVGLHGQAVKRRGP